MKGLKTYVETHKNRFLDELISLLVMLLHSAKVFVNLVFLNYRKPQTGSCIQKKAKPIWALPNAI